MLHWATQEYIKEEMKLDKGKFVDWRKVSKGMNNLALIFYFSQIQEKNL